MIGVELPEAQPSTALPEDLPLEILFNDADVVVVNKPAGMVVHPAAGNPSGTLVNALLHHVKDLSGIGGEVRPGIVHRLDKGTSGVMVIAKNDDAHKELARQFHDREVEKEYVALAWGLVQQRKRINAAIGRDPKNRVKMSTRAGRARHAVTRVTWSRDLKGVTLLRVAIATGRTHQIRVHLSAIGHPIVGDALYGGVHRRVPHPLRAVTKLTRPFLHAERLVFTHPRTGSAWNSPRRCLPISKPSSRSWCRRINSMRFSARPTAEPDRGRLRRGAEFFDRFGFKARNACQRDAAQPLLEKPGRADGAFEGWMRTSCALVPKYNTASSCCSIGSTAHSLAGSGFMAPSTNCMRGRLERGAQYRRGRATSRERPQTPGAATTSLREMLRSAHRPESRW